MPSKVGPVPDTLKYIEQNKISTRSLITKKKKTNTKTIQNYTMYMWQCSTRLSLVLVSRSLVRLQEKGVCSINIERQVWIPLPRYVCRGRYEADRTDAVWHQLHAGGEASVCVYVLCVCVCVCAWERGVCIWSLGKLDFWWIRLFLIFTNHFAIYIYIYWIITTI